MKLVLKTSKNFVSFNPRGKNGWIPWNLRFSCKKCDLAINVKMWLEIIQLPKMNIIPLAKSTIEMELFEKAKPILKSF